MRRFYLQDFIREVDPDVIIGYNICKFDLPYLIEVTEVFQPRPRPSSFESINIAVKLFLFCL